MRRRADRSRAADGAGRRASARALAFCVVLALVLRVAALLTVGHPEIRRGDLFLTSDEPSFHLTAVAVATTGRYSRGPGGPPTAFRPPAAVLPLAALYYLVRPSLAVGIGYVILCSLGVVVAAHRLAYATSGDSRVGIVAALLAAIMPTLVFTGSAIWSEPQAVLLTLLVLHLVIRRRGGSGEWLAIGLCASVAYLTRPSVVFLLPFLVAGALLGSGARLANAAVLIAALALPIGLWGARNRLVLGEFLTGATVAGEALYGSNNPVTAGTSLPARDMRGPFDLRREARAGSYLGSWVPMEYIPGWEEANPPGTSELDVYHHQMRATIDFVRARPGSWLRLLGHKLARLTTVESYAPSVTGDVGARRVIHGAVTLVEVWFVLGWGVAGIVDLVRSRSRASGWYGCFALAGLANVLLTYPNPRFLLPLTSVLIPPAAIALTRRWDASRRRSRVDLRSPPVAEYGA